MLLIGVLIPLTSHTAYADDNSLQDVATQFANAGSGYATDGKNGKHINTPGEAWNYLGPGSKSVLATGAKGTKTATYDALSSAGSGKAGESFELAGKFAYALSHTGLDHPSQGNMNIIIVIGRKVVALFLTLILYMIYISQTILQIMYNFFKWVNPFYALGALVDAKKYNVSNSMFAPLMQFVSPIYNFIQNLSLTGTILALAFTIMMTLAGFNIQKNDKAMPHYHYEGLGRVKLSRLIHYITKAFIRIMLIFGAPILIAELSSDLLNDMDASLNVTDSIALKQIYSNFIDFDAWVNHSRLALPDASNPIGGQGNDKTTGNMNKLNANGDFPFTGDYILAINANGGGIAAAKNAINLSSDSGSVVSMDTKPKEQKVSAKDDVDRTAGMLHTFADGSTINANEWESTVLSGLRTTAASATDNGKVDNKNYGHGKNRNWAQRQIDGIHWWWDTTFGKGKTKIDTTKPWTLITANNYDDKSIYKNDVGIGTTLDYSKGQFVSDNPSYSKRAAGNKKDGAGLSTIGMYNYLNTYADGTGLQYTQPKNFLGFGTVNQHASVGFIGHGMLSIGTFFRMTVMMATAAFVCFFVAILILKGVTSSIPNILMYAAELATGKLSGLKGVIKVMVGMYARIALGVFIVYFFENTADTIDNWLDSALMSGKLGLGSATIINVGGHGIQLMPFGISMGALGLARLFEGIVTGLLLFAVLKTYHDLIKWLNKAIDHALSFMGTNSAAARSVVPNTPMPNTSMRSNNARSNPQMPNMPNDTPPNLDPNNPFSDYMDNDATGQTPNTAKALNAKYDDPNYEDGQKNMGLKDGLKKQMGMLGLDSLDKFENSKAGQGIMKGASKLGAAVGGSLLGRALGAKGRGEGAQAAEKGMKKLRQAIAAKADPNHVNNSKRATMTQAEKAKTDALEKNAKDTASDNALKRAHDQTQLAKRFAKNGQLKNPSQMGDTVNALKKNGLANKDLKRADNMYKNLATKQMNTNQQKRNKANQLAQEKTKKYQDLVKRAKHGDLKAQNALPAAKREMMQAKRNANKMNIATDQKKLQKAISSTGKIVGRNGENLRQLKPKELSKAQDRLFTSMTGQKLAKGVNKEDVKATPEMQKQAQESAQKARKILNDPMSNMQERYNASQTLKDADVVNKTGYQFGQFSDPDTQEKYDTASDDELKNADAYRSQDEFATQTGMGVSKDAPNATPAVKAYADKYEQAQQILNTGEVQDQNGSHVATSKEMRDAQDFVKSSPERQTQLIQNQMMSTANDVMAKADKAGRDVSIPEGATPQEARAIRQKAHDSYLASPQARQNLEQVGLISPNAKPAEIKQQLGQVQHLNNLTRTSMSASIEPLRQQITSQGIVGSPQAVIRNAAQTEYGQLKATNRWVDTHHYGQTTNMQVHHVAQQLLNAHASGNTHALTIARQQADKIGLSNDIKNNPQALRNVIKTYQNEEDNIINRAISRQAMMPTSTNDSLTMPLGGTNGMTTKENLASLRSAIPVENINNDASHITKNIGNNTTLPGTDA